MSIFGAFNRFPQEAVRVGRMLAGYSVLELDLLHCVHMGTGDFDAALKAMFGRRGETRRINEAETLGQPIYDRLSLGSEFRYGIQALRACLKIRNQYAHCTWWDDYSGKLAKNPPLRLVLGSDAYARAERTDETRLVELRA